MKPVAAAVYCFLFLVLIIFSRCTFSSENVKLNLQKADTLKRMVMDIDGMLILDEDAVRMRLDTIKKIIGYIEKHPVDTSKGELKSAWSRYVGIRKNYELFLQDYPVLEYDLEKHKTIVENLRKKAGDENTSSDEFNLLFVHEKEALGMLRSKSQTVTYSVLGVEQDYRRSKSTLLESVPKAFLRQSG